MLYTTNTNCCWNFYYLKLKFFYVNYLISKRQERADNKFLKLCVTKAKEA